ncbi:Z1 domain-containing protein [Rhodovulum sp. FJ3]|uniref:Z1 domain-containing protein n=1 Tax=Rhodovulum sp. FJ3 TaxID=3079053 RepID=UPI00293DDE6F|nr:Z1 domain-containing protein [Rhodovulum sp. FJ3]MDV4167936.1 Z1 domain-containing protein [Rhodovulum sp. FJ3]
MSEISNYEILDAQVSQALVSSDKKTADELRALISTLNSVMPAMGYKAVSPDQEEILAREFEERNGISMGLGAVVTSEDFEPWLDEAKQNIDPFYWKRYREHLIRTGLPKDVVIKLDDITDKTLGRMGNPQKNVAWNCKGMVVGHVQSGKTANYTGLICKAADAGYRLVIVIAGIHNNLRNQTQQRIDEGFIGRDTGSMYKGGKSDRCVGVGLFDDRNVPVSLTTTIDDFKKAIATTNKSRIDSYKVPVVLVIKKNYSTLGNLIDWLKENSSHGDEEMISQPMLLIDDEADNASINTKYGKKEVTRINGQIRELLGLFHRSCYVGYTATPFANIFIDPDQEDDMLGEDLFPRDFIIGLDAPSNYFGGSKVFLEGIPEDDSDPEFIRYIDDNDDILPVKHKIDHELNELPVSLTDALRAFLVARTIRNLRGQADKHASMLVNASRFTRVQGLLRIRLHEVLDNIQNSLRVNGAKGDAADRDPEIAALKAIWAEEFSDSGFGWPEVRAALHVAVASAKVVEVNSSRNDLDYSTSGKQGITVIAVGGFSLSRGLTLEGLTTTWFLRNTMMYDTLMQMGRWFGYRMGYDDLCRIWMPREAVSWYAHIAAATEELHQELRLMESAKATPKQFGLAVRSHPSALMVTARNKLGSGKKTVSIGLSSNFVETARLTSNAEDLQKNRAAAETFVSRLRKNGYSQENTETVKGGYLLKAVPVETVDDFLLAWVNADESITTQIDPIRNYIRKRQGDELAEWDVHIATLKTGAVDKSLGWPIVPITRRIGAFDLQRGFMSIGGSKMRVSSRGVERLGIPEELALETEAAHRVDRSLPNGTKVNYPGKIYREVRERPLIALYLVEIKEPENAHISDHKDFPDKPVVAWAISFPKSARADEKVEYIINTTKQRELFGDPDTDEEEDYAYEQ